MHSFIYGGMTDGINVVPWPISRTVQPRHNCKYKKCSYKYSPYNTLNTDNKQGLHHIKLNEGTVLLQKTMISASSTNTSILASE